MIGRREMANEVDIVGPRKGIRVLSPADQEFPARQAARWFNEQLLERALPVDGESAHVRQIAHELVSRRRRLMDQWIDAAVNGHHASSSEPCLKLVESSSARIAQNNIEVGQPARADVRERIAGFELFERDWRIQIVKSADGHRRIEHEIRGSNAIRTIGGDDSG